MRQPLFILFFARKAFAHAEYTGEHNADRYAEQHARNEIPHIAAARHTRDSAERDAHNDEKHTVEHVFLLFKLLGAAHELKYLPVVVCAYAPRLGALAVHQLGKRNAKLTAERRCDAVIGHTLARLPL